MQIQETQKHTDPTAPDPNIAFLHNALVYTYDSNFGRRTEFWTAVSGLGSGFVTDELNKIHVYDLFDLFAKSSSPPTF